MRHGDLGTVLGQRGSGCLDGDAGWFGGLQVSQVVIIAKSSRFYILFILCFGSMVERRRRRAGARATAQGLGGVEAELGCWEPAVVRRDLEARELGGA